jgi:hypothetical protein
MFVVGYPKSGNTWLSYLLAYCLNTEFDDFDSPGIHPRRDFLRKLVKGGLPHKTHAQQLDKVLKTHKLSMLHGRSPIVYALRDGRDVMVSLYCNKKYFRGEPVGEFDSFLEKFTQDWAQHIKACLNKRELIVARYEELSVSPENTLRNIFERLDVEVDDTVIGDSISLFSFEKMSKRAKGCENLNSFFRKGIVGDWKNYFNDHHKLRFKSAAGELLIALGYEKDDNW